MIKAGDSVSDYQRFIGFPYRHSGSRYPMNELADRPVCAPTLAPMKKPPPGGLRMNASSTGIARMCSATPTVA
jgi:hypothetical protein